MNRRVVTIHNNPARTSKKSESDKHRMAKNLICNYLNDGFDICIDTGCKKHKKLIILNSCGNNVSQEVRYKNEYGVSIFDVMWNTNTGIYGVEIYASHKAEDQTRVGVTWVEVRASEVIRKMNTVNIQSVKLRDIRQCTLCAEDGMITSNPMYKNHLNGYTEDGFRIAMELSLVKVIDGNTLPKYDLIMYEIMTNRVVKSIVYWKSTMGVLTPSEKKRLIEHGRCLSCGKSKRKKKYMMASKPLCRICYYRKIKGPFYQCTISTRRDILYQKAHILLSSLYNLRNTYNESCMGCGSNECISYIDSIIPGCRDCIANKLSI